MSPPLVLLLGFYTGKLTLREVGRYDPDSGRPDRRQANENHRRN